MVIKYLQIVLVVCSVLVIHGVRNPKEIEYREKKLLTPSLEDVRNGKLSNKKEGKFVNFFFKF